MSPQYRNLLLRALDPTFLVAAAATIAFYAFMHSPVMQESFLQRYTTRHIIEYIVITMFIWGITDIVFKVGAFPREMVALRHEWLPQRFGREPVSHAATILEGIRAQPQWMQNSRVGKRLTHALEYVHDKGSADEYREQVQYLADQDEETVHSSYTLIRFIIAIAPVLGFLGTVIHFGTALSGISVDQMAERLGHVVSEMGEAFDTTAVALAASMTMMFALFLCERNDSQILKSIDRLIERELLNRFEVKDPSITPFLYAVKTANDDALQQIAVTLQKHIDLWSQSLALLFQKFDARQETENTGWRDSLTEILGSLQERHELYDSTREDRLRQILALIESRQDKFMAHVQTTLERAVSIRDDFGDLLATLGAIARGEGRLVELQTLLTDNLKVLRETQALDDAMHGLSTGDEQSRPYVAGSKIQPRRNLAA